MLRKSANPTYPPIETAHSWRQSDVMMIARNFYEVSPNILFPRVDYNNGTSGIVATEFPLMNYLIYILSIILGYNHGLGRLVNLIFSAIGSYYFYMIVKKYINEQTAFLSTIILTCSLWFVYARKAMPDIFAISLVIGSVYHGLCYFDQKRKIMNLLLFLLFGTLGMLSKISSGYLFSVFLIPIIITRKRVKEIIPFIIACILILGSIVWWYYIWVPHLKSLSSVGSFFMGVPFYKGIKGLMDNPGMTLKRFYETPLMFSGFTCFLLGIFFVFKNKHKLLFGIISLCTISFMVFMLRMGSNFSVHTYYILVFIPPMALIAGYGIANIPWRWMQLSLLIVICIENIANNWTDFYPRAKKMELIRLEKIVDQHCDQGKMIAINCSPDPLALYMAHRKGWMSYNYQLQNADFREDIRMKGCSYVLILKNINEGNLELPMEVIFEDQDFKIYKF